MYSKKSKLAFEVHLNELYTDMYSEEQAIEQFDYLTSKERKPKTTVAYIRKSHANHELGTMLRRLNPDTFNKAYNEWRI